jgi:hypothetical protein
MARQEKGALNYIGKFKGIKNYKILNSDIIYASTIGEVPKSIRENNPAYVNVRKENFEFSARSKLASDILAAMGDWAQPIVNRYFQSKMTAIMNDVMVLDKDMSHRGHRNIYLSRFKDLLLLLDAYYYYKPLTEVMRCPYNVINNGERNSVTVVIKGLYPLKQISGPDKASHIRICLSIGCVKDYTYNAEYNMYGSYDLRGGYFWEETKTDWIPIDAGLMDDITLTVSLPEDHVLEESETVLRSIGIEYGRMTAEVSLLKKDRGSIAFLGAV